MTTTSLETDALLPPGEPRGGTAPASDGRKVQARRILLSATASRLGSRCWEFAAPLLLLEWSPGSLAAPAAFGLTCALARVLASPWLGGKADGWDGMNAILVGAAMQASGCMASVGALAVWNWLSSMEGGGDAPTKRLVSLALVIAAGVVEKLGAQLCSVAVKKEWVPIVFEESGDDFDATESATATATGRSGGNFAFSCIDPPVVNLSFINTSMTNIDLLAAMLGPVLTGWILQVLGGGGDGGDLRAYSVQRGFAAIALINAISFIPEMILLRAVYDSCPSLQRKREGVRSAKTEIASAERSKEDGAPRNPWTVWFHHPSGLPLLTLSLASLYLTALAPSGVVLTAYLMTIGLSPSAIGAFRAMGALSGVVGISLFSLMRNWGEARGSDVREDATGRSMLIRSIERLRRVSMASLLLEVVSVLVALVETDGPLPWQIVIFLGSIVLSRAGLYAFDLGALEIEQYIVDERFRNAVGSVEGALCSIAEMGMYLMSMVLSDPSDFGWQVGVSATAVSFGGGCFGAFLCMY
ncbi:hypothetical protein JZU56_01945, partial [bacterium]|nr:hypothetical protein [bacterium]